MIAHHRGHTIDVRREESLGGDMLLYYAVVRDSDGYCCVDSFEDSDHTVRELIGHMKARVDNELAEDDPWGERADEEHWLEVRREARAQRGRVIAAFPATGKSYLAADDDGYVDSDSSSFSGSEPGIRHPEWPGNYVEHVRGQLVEGKVVLVSTHAEVRRALVDAGIPFKLAYPTPDQREEYRRRMIGRGSPDGLIRKVIDELWDDALVECFRQEGCEHLVLRPGEYLGEALARA